MSADTDLRARVRGFCAMFNARDIEGCLAASEGVVARMDALPLRADPLEAGGGGLSAP